MVAYFETMYELFNKIVNNLFFLIQNTIAYSVYALYLRTVHLPTASLRKSRIAHLGYKHNLWITLKTPKLRVAPHSFFISTSAYFTGVYIDICVSGSLNTWFEYHGLN